MLFCSSSSTTEYIPHAPPDATPRVEGYDPACNQAADGNETLGDYTTNCGASTSTGQPDYESQEIEKMKKEIKELKKVNRKNLKRLEDLEQSNRQKDEVVANLRYLHRHVEINHLLDTLGGLRDSQASIPLSVDESIQEQSIDRSSRRVSEISDGIRLKIDHINKYLWQQGKLTDENFHLVYGDEANEFELETEQGSSSSISGRLQTLNPLKQLEKRTNYLVNENYRLKAKLLDENLKNKKKVSEMQNMCKCLPIELQNLHRKNVLLKKKLEEKTSSTTNIDFIFKRKTT